MFKLFVFLALLAVAIAGYVPYTHVVKQPVYIAKPVIVKVPVVKYYQPVVHAVPHYAHSYGHHYYGHF